MIASAPSDDAFGAAPFARRPSAVPYFTLSVEMPQDVAAREALLDLAMGPMRRRKASEALRRGRAPARGLSLVARDGRGILVGTVRLWHVAAGEGAAAGDEGTAALLLGPLAVAPHLAGAGIGSALMRRAIAEAQWQGHSAILLVGDPDYYERFGFSAAPAARLAMPGPFERHRLLALELKEKSLAGAEGLIRATGRRIRLSQSAGAVPNEARVA